MAPQNTVATDYDLKTLLDLIKYDVLTSMNCHAIGTIQGFDSTKQTAIISMNYKRVVYGAPNASPTLQDYPLVLDCPVIVLGGGNGSLSFPIQPGDTCLILFNDRDISSWFSGGQVTSPATPRLHSFSDGIALVGLRSLQNVISDYDATHTVLRKGSTKISLDSKVKIENAMITLLQVINGLIDLIAAATVSGVHLDNAAAISAYKTIVGELLE
jgi:hypothetical protein